MPYIVPLPEQVPTVGGRFGTAIGSGAKRRLEEAVLAMLTGGASLAGAQGRKAANVQANAATPQQTGALQPGTTGQIQQGGQPQQNAQPNPQFSVPQRILQMMFPPSSDTINKFAGLQSIYNAPLERQKLEAEIKLQQSLPEIYRQEYRRTQGALSQGNSSGLSPDILQQIEDDALAGDPGAEAAIEYLDSIGVY